MNECNMGHHPSYIARLLRKIQQKSCPLLMKFQNENVAGQLIGEKNIIAVNILHKIIKIAGDKPPIQREVLGLQKGAPCPRPSVQVIKLHCLPPRSPNLCSRSHSPKPHLKFEVN